VIEEKDFQHQKIKLQTWKVIFSFAAGYKKVYGKLLGGSMLIGRSRAMWRAGAAPSTGLGACSTDRRQGNRETWLGAARRPARPPSRATQRLGQVCAAWRSSNRQNVPTMRYVAFRFPGSRIVSAS
jgi:selenocysteine lyase/cysteine desulfurase